eukprot:TRINITY_DN72088_c0_g1_i1.p1 TRINITY_DN72088_c0_g1~~TRINITY_DN72088_c0_g1_i1.p1  ORF type:complete len:342 (+),score=71.33 TRINITY_DN72088_c0_g1_i1:97-1122(+)
MEWPAAEPPPPLPDPLGPGSPASAAPFQGAPLHAASLSPDKGEFGPVPVPPDPPASEGCPCCGRGTQPSILSVTTTTTAGQPSQIWVGGDLLSSPSAAGTSDVAALRLELAAALEEVVRLREQLRAAGPAQASGPVHAPAPAAAAGRRAASVAAHRITAVASAQRQSERLLAGMYFAKLLRLALVAEAERMADVAAGGQRRLLLRIRELESRQEAAPSHPAALQRQKPPQHAAEVLLSATDRGLRELYMRKLIAYARQRWKQVTSVLYARALRNFIRGNARRTLHRYWVKLRLFGATGLVRHVAAAAQQRRGPDHALLLAAQHRVSQLEAQLKVLRGGAGR